MNKFNYGFTLIFLIALAACNNGGGAGGPGLTAKASQGKFVSQKTLAPGEAADAFKHSSSSCSDSDGARSVFDSRIKVGASQSVIASLTSFSGKKFAGEATQRVTGADSNSITITTTSNLEGVADIETATCKKSDGSISCTEAAKPLRPSLLDSGSIEKQCNIQADEGTSTSSTIEVGSYVLASGQSLPTYRITSTTTGEVTCDGTDLGHGTQNQVSVITSAIPSLYSSSSCDVVALLGTSTIVLSNGKTRSTSFEVTSFQ